MTIWDLPEDLFDRVYAEIELATARAAPLFQLMGWSWGHGDSRHVPCSSEIHDFLEKLAGDCLDSDEAVTVSGGRLAVCGDKKSLEFYLCLGDVELEPEKEDDPPNTPALAAFAADVAAGAEVAD